MKISEQVRILAVKEVHTTMYPTLIINDADVILIDTGLPTSLSALKEALKEEGFTLKDITKIFLTHQDWDHIGCINQILKEVPDVKIYCHELEKPYIEGTKIPIKVEALKDRGKEEAYQLDKQKFEALYCKIDGVFTGGEVLPGNIHVIHTPGHTIGHIVFYLPDVKTLIAGDALNVVEGKLIGSRDIFTQDKKQAKETLKQLVSLPIDTIVCYHGGLYQEECNKKIEKIIKNP
jgi:glyoxylase-like metal-dependent hydrolase (beta-lactamase superfamily II)